MAMEEDEAQQVSVKKTGVGYGKISSGRVGSADDFFPCPFYQDGISYDGGQECKFHAGTSVIFFGKRSTSNAV